MTDNMSREIPHLYQADCLEFLKGSAATWDTIFADPPDNIGLEYDSYRDHMPKPQYVAKLDAWLRAFLDRANTVWLSFNSRWICELGRIVACLLERIDTIEVLPCVQTFTFGQHLQTDLGNNHRPLWRFRWRDAPLFPEAIRVASCRQENGDKRADPRGRVPGDVFDFPRVTGNSKQRRDWHPTQLHEGLVERCVRLTTPPGGTVLDPFAGTGTTLRVCNRTGHVCTLVEMDRGYCRKISEEHGLRAESLDDLGGQQGQPVRRRLSEVQASLF